MLIKYKAVSILDGTEVSFDREEWARSAVEEGWIASYEPYEAPEPHVDTPEEIRVREIDAELAQLDVNAQRPLCSVLSGLGSEDDAALLAAIEGMKIELREERRMLLFPEPPVEEEPEENYEEVPKGGGTVEVVEDIERSDE